MTIKSGTTFNNKVFHIQLIDLTQLNPFVASWSLLTPQVQKLLSMGYIPKNSGEIVDSAVSEITCDANGSRIGSLQLPAPFQLGGVNTAKNTMQITDSGYVFTRKTFRCDFSSFEYVSADGVFRKQITDATSDTHYEDFLHSRYNFAMLTTLANLANGDITRSNQWFYIKDTSTTDPSALAGDMEYTLATPQVITIPRKHLAVVDLGSLNGWITNAGTNTECYQMSIPNASTSPSSPTQIANIYCSNFITDTANNVRNHVTQGISMQSGIVSIYRQDLIGKTANEVKALLSGLYLFYETQDEVADIDFKLTVEAGGTLNADSDVLADVAFEFKCK